MAIIHAESKQEICVRKYLYAKNIQTTLLFQENLVTEKYFQKKI